MGVFHKNGNWWIDFYQRGKRFRRKVGPSKKVAEMALADAKIKIARKEFLGIVEPERVFFRDFAVEFLEYSKSTTAFETFKGHRYAVKLLLPLWGELSLEQITAKMIEDHKIRRREKVSPGSVNKELGAIKKLFRKAVEWGYLEQSPAMGVKFLKTAKSPARFLSEEEIRCLLDSCSQSEGSHLRPIVIVALHTGMRRGEIMNLQWNDVDFKERRINVVSRSAKSTKNYESRSIPMNETVYQVLKSHPRQLRSPYLFSEAEGRFCVNLNYEFPKAVNRAGIPHARFHDLRHSFASHLVMKGVDIRTVQVLMGHKSLQMTMKYAHLAPGHMRAAVEVLDGHDMDTGRNISSDFTSKKKAQPFDISS